MLSILREFYGRPLGSAVRRLLTQPHPRALAQRRRVRSCGVGLRRALHRHVSRRGRRVGALMPATQGALVWPTGDQVQSVLVEEAMLPLGDASLDRLLAVHCLEATERSGPLLREIWRVLTPEGRLLLVVPNRRGIWARLDTTPFGHGRPYSRGQLERLLNDALFTPLEWTGALYMPPIDRQWLVRWATGFRARWRAAVAGLCRRDHRRGAERADGRHPGGGKARSARRPGDGARYAQALRRAAAFGAVNAGRSRPMGPGLRVGAPERGSCTVPRTWLHGRVFKPRRRSRPSRSLPSAPRPRAPAGSARCPDYNL